MKSKFLHLCFAFGLFFVWQKMNKTVLIKGRRKDEKRGFFVINKIALTHLVISDPCQNKSAFFENYTKQFLSI